MLFHIAFLLTTLLFTRGAILQPRIINGQVASEGQFPYLVMLKYDKIFYGAGTIISSKIILTAAHCLTPVPSATYLTVTGGTIKQNGGVVYNVSNFHIHPDYISEPNTLNDIGIIELKEEITFTDDMKPIPLNTEDIYKEKFSEGVVPGFGFTATDGPTSDVMLYVKLKMMDKKTCSQMKGYPAKNDFCMETDNDGTCEGDSGGPLASDGKLIGVVSWGWLPCGKFPSVFTRVDKFIPWIQSFLS